MVTDYNDYKWVVENGVPAGVPSAGHSGDKPMKAATPIRLRPAQATMKVVAYTISTCERGSSFHRRWMAQLKGTITSVRRKRETVKGCHISIGIPSEDLQGCSH